MKTKRIACFLAPLIFAQAFLGMRVILRLLRSAGGERISTKEALDADEERVSVIVPVLNERHRLSPCLEGLIAQGSEVAEIVVVDGGSDDGTQQLVCVYARRDPRVRLVETGPIPANWNGKAGGLQVGLRSVNARSQWILTVDADVRPGALLTRALLGRAKQAGLSALSIATLQEIDDVGEGLLHPSLLATLVYRFGIPGKTFGQVNEVQANGQAFRDRIIHFLEREAGLQGLEASIVTENTFMPLDFASELRSHLGAAGLEVAALCGMLRRILAANTCFQGIMCYAVREAVYLAAQGFDDLLVGYPCWHREDIAEVARATKAGTRITRITLMVDSAAHVEQVEAAASECGVRLPLCLDMDIWTYQDR